MGGTATLRALGEPEMKQTLTILMLGPALACSDGAAPPADAAVQQGKTIYENVCIVCHNADPNLEGSLGPAIAGASRELLSAKVLRGEYPIGYTPKRPGQTMPRLTYLADGIDALAAYLASGAPNAKAGGAKPPALERVRTAASTTGSTGRDREPR